MACIEQLIADAEAPRDEENLVATDQFAADYEGQYCPSFRDAWWEAQPLWGRLSADERKAVLPHLHSR